MFEQSFKFKKEELEEEVSPEKRKAIFEDFDKKEAVIQKEAEGFLMNLVPEKFKKEAVGLLAAFSIFTASSSAFAEEVKAEAGEKLSPEKQVEELATRPASPQELFKKITGPTEEEFAPFDWKKVADKIEISVGGEFEKIPEYNPEVIDSPVDITRQFEYLETVIDSGFYKGLSGHEGIGLFGDFINVIEDSKNYNEFLGGLKALSAELDDVRKVYILQSLGRQISKTYNFDLLESEENVEISDEVMYQGLRDLIVNNKASETGKCGNISIFLMKVAQEMGLESWAQSGSTKKRGHIWNGMVAGKDDGKQIVFLDNETLIPTGTLDYRDAIGIVERYHRSVNALNSFVGNEEEVLFPVKSRAQEVVEKAVGIEEVGEKLEAELAEGKLKKERGLEINLSPETKEIKLNKDTFGLAYFNFQDFSNNPYQSLEDLNALRGRINLKGERLGLEADATIVHMNIKDLYGDSVEQKEIIGRLAADYIDSRKFAKKDYGQFLLNFGTTFQGAVRFIDEKISEEALKRWSGESALGARLIYINPAETGKFYVGASEMFRGQKDDFQNQDTIIKEVAKTLTVGAEIKVNEAQILNLGVAGSELDWGKKMKIKGGVEGEQWKGGVEYEKATSEYERFVPSSEKVSAEVGYKGGPKWEVDVIGSKTTEKYKDAEGEDIYNAEVKLKIFLW